MIKINPSELVLANNFEQYSLLEIFDIPEVLRRSKEFLWMNIEDNLDRGVKDVAQQILKMIPDAKKYLNKDLTDEEKRNVQLHACAMSYAQWVREAMFKVVK